MRAYLCWAIMGAFLLAGPARAESTVPSATLQEILIKTALLTLNDANLTGNYTVLHAKLAKVFRDQITPDGLQKGFKPFADQKVDFGTHRSKAADRLHRSDDRQSRRLGPARLLRHRAEPRHL